MNKRVEVEVVGAGSKTLAEVYASLCSRQGRFWIEQDRNEAQEGLFADNGPAPVSLQNCREKEKEK